VLEHESEVDDEKSEGTLLLALFIYYAAIVWLHWDHGNKWLIFQPFYCLFVSLIVVPIGVAYYFKMAIPERNFGVIRPKRNCAGRRLR